MLIAYAELKAVAQSSSRIGSRVADPSSLFLIGGIDMIECQISEKEKRRICDVLPYWTRELLRICEEAEKKHKVLKSSLK
jgi:Ni,Fe-hydrogenase III large subunit